MAVARGAVFALLLVCSQAQLMLNTMSGPTDAPSSDLSLQMSNDTDSNLPNLGDMLMDLITLAKQLSSNVPDQPRPMPPWRRMDGGNDQQGQGFGGSDPSGQAVRIINGVSVSQGDGMGQMQQQNSPMSSMPQVTFAVMPFSRMGDGKMGFGRPMSLMGQGLLQRGDGDQEQSRPIGFGRAPWMRHGNDDDQDSSEGRRRPHGRPMPRPNRDDDESDRRGPEDLPHWRPMPRPDREDDDDNEGPMGPRRHHGRRPEQKDDQDFDRPSRDEDDDEKRGGRQGGDQQDDEERPMRRRDDDDNDNEDEDDQMQGEGHGRRPKPHHGGPDGRGGRHGKKPKCKKIIKFLLAKLHERRRHGGRGGRGGRGESENGNEGMKGRMFGKNFEDMKDMKEMKGQMFGNQFEDESDSNDNIIFPRRMPFDVEGDDE